METLTMMNVVMTAAVLAVTCCIMLNIIGRGQYVDG